MAAPQPAGDPEPKPLIDDSGALSSPSDPGRAELRRFRLSVTGLVFLLLVLTGAYVLLRKSQEYDPTVAGGRIVLYAVFSLNLVLVLAIAVTLFRNIFKLVFERRRDILGSRFSTKLVAAFLAQGIVPTALLFIAGSELINITTTKWFSTDVDAVTDAALRIAQRQRREIDRQALARAEAVSAELSRLGLFELGRRAELTTALREMLVRHDLVGIVAQVSGAAPQEVTDAQALPVRLPEIPDAILMRWWRGERFARHQDLAEGKGAVSFTGVPVLDSDGGTLGVVVVITKSESSLDQDERLVTSAREEFKRRELSKGFIVATNVSILLLVTLLVLLGAVWMGLVMARGITVPIQRLAEGTQAVSLGDLDHMVTAPAADELKMLVDSFNRMTRELKGSKQALERSVGELQRSNEELAERRMFIETVLQNVAAGVLCWDRDATLTACNAAAVRLLRLPPDQVGLPIGDVLRGTGHEGLRTIVGATLAGAGPQERQVALLAGGSERVLQAITTPLRSVRDGSLSGAVLVLEDVSDLIKAQKTSAWREVARRMAHEIKNPLTPIQLSAERVLLKVPDLGPDHRGVTAVREGARIILEEVRTLKTLVDEFSRFARLPQVSLRAGDLNDVVRNAVALYEKAVSRGRFRVELDPALPIISLDAEQMKRAIMNLVDNALVAMGSEGAVTLRTWRDADRGMICLEVGDEGPGIPAADRPKLFMPHFSTKKRGTGLGLAIVDRVIADHGGYIRVEDNRPRGTRFIMELPCRREATGAMA